MPEKISTTTIRRRLHSMEYCYKTVPNKIFLTHNQMMRRVHIVKNGFAIKSILTKRFTQMNASLHWMVTIPQAHGQKYNQQVTEKTIPWWFSYSNGLYLL